MGNDNEQKIADAMRQWRARAIEDEATIAKLQAEAVTLRAMVDQLRGERDAARKALAEVFDEAPIDIVWLIQNKAKRDQWRLDAGI